MKAQRDRKRMQWRVWSGSLFPGRAALRLFILAIVVLGFAPLAAGQTVEEPATATGYTLTWWTVDGGGSTVGHGAYTLSSTAGQPDAATAAANGYTLVGGFWGGEEQAGRYYSLYLPLILRSIP